MIPLKHTVPPRIRPIVTRSLVATNFAVFILQIYLGPRAETLINIFGFIPSRLLHPASYGYSLYEVVVSYARRAAQTRPERIRFGDT